MHVLTVCYGHPADPVAFDEYYTSTHVPLVNKLLIGKCRYGAWRNGLRGGFSRCGQ